MITYEEMTPKQKQAVKDLQKDCVKRGMKKGAKSVLMMLAMNIGNVIVNALTIQSDQFFQFMMVATFVIVLAELVNWSEKERKRIEEQLEKIVADKT